MRISADRADPAYSRQMANIYLDGAMRSGVVVADEESRTVVMYARDQFGRLLLNSEGDAVRRETLRGDVRIELLPGLRSE